MTNSKVNLGRSGNNDFKESRAALVARLFIEENNLIKTHFMEMDKTPNFDGKLMILEGEFERITVEVQIKSLPENIKKNKKGEFKFQCDTKAMNCVLHNVTFNPVVLFAVDTRGLKVYYKLLTKDYVNELKIGTKKRKTIYMSEVDRFEEAKFINHICKQVKITVTNEQCLIESLKIHNSIRNAENTGREEFELVFVRGNVLGYFTTYKYFYDDDKKYILVSTIKMECNGKSENLTFQYDRDYIHINRVPSDLIEIRDADIANIIIEISKTVNKPILYTNEGKPIYWFNSRLMWQLRAEEILLDELLS